MKKRRDVTLIEIMIVILLIGLIGGALAFNMRGSLDKGKAFKTEQNAERIRDILMLEVAQGNCTPQAACRNWEQIVLASPIVKGREIIEDGWKERFRVRLENGDITVHSERLERFNHDHASAS